LKYKKGSSKTPTEENSQTTHGGHPKENSPKNNPSSLHYDHLSMSASVKKLEVPQRAQNTTPYNDSSSQARLEKLFSKPQISNSVNGSQLRNAKSSSIGSNNSSLERSNLQKAGGKKTLVLEGNTIWDWDTKNIFAENHRRNNTKERMSIVSQIKFSRVNKKKIEMGQLFLPFRSVDDVLLHRTKKVQNYCNEQPSQLGNTLTQRDDPRDTAICFEFERTHSVGKLNARNTAHNFYKAMNHNENRSEHKFSKN
jgi:hypothetical protein